MAIPLNTLAHTPYPVVANNLTNDPTPKDQAIYVPSVTPSYAIDVHAQNWKRPLPNSVGAGDLNFLDPNNPLFRISHVMSSAGQALDQTRRCIITERDRQATKLICDSGGYQIASGGLTINGDYDRLRILHWMEKHGDLGMTLDVPTGPLGNPIYPYKTFQQCLDDTEVHLRFFASNRSSNSLQLLNVLQGNDQTQADAWYDVVKKYEFEGWAFAGILRHNIASFCRRILVMYDEGQIQNKNWIHVLGTCELETAVLMTAIQRSINRHINDKLRISFDTSSPFRCMANNQAYSLPVFKTKQMTMPMYSAPNDHRYIDSPLKWPWPSPLGDRMLMRDFCVRRPRTANYSNDAQSNCYLAHHNLAALCSAIALANRVFDVDHVTRKPTICRPVVAAVEAIDEVFRVRSMEVLDRYSRTTFSHLKHSDVYDLTGDHERALLI